MLMEPFRPQVKHLYVFRVTLEDFVFEAEIPGDAEQVIRIDIETFLEAWCLFLPDLPGDIVENMPGFFP